MIPLGGRAEVAQLVVSFLHSPSHLGRRFPVCLPSSDTGHGNSGHVLHAFPSFTAHARGSAPASGRDDLGRPCGVSLRTLGFSPLRGVQTEAPVAPSLTHESILQSRVPVSAARQIPWGPWMPLMSGPGTRPRASYLAVHGGTDRLIPQ